MPFLQYIFGSRRRRPSVKRRGTLCVVSFYQRQKRTYDASYRVVVSRHSECISHAHPHRSRIPSTTYLAPCSAATLHILSSYRHFVSARNHVSTSRCASGCPPLAPTMIVLASHGASFSLHQRKTPTWPRSAAAKHVHSFHGQKCSRAYRSAFRFPTLAAFAHVYLLHTQPFVCANSMSLVSSWIATAADVRASHGHPARRKYRNISRWPPHAAAAR